MDFTRKNSATSTQCSSCGGATWGSASQASSSQNGQPQAVTHQPSSPCVCSLPWRSDVGVGSSSRGGPQSSNSTRAGYSSDAGSIWTSSGGGGRGSVTSDVGVGSSSRSGLQPSNGTRAGYSSDISSVWASSEAGSAWASNGSGSVWASSGGGGRGSVTGDVYNNNTSPPPSAADDTNYRLQGGYEAYSHGAPVSPTLERFQFSTSRYDNPSVWMGGGYNGQEPSQQTLDIGGGSPATAHVETHLEEINQRLPRSCQPGSNALTRRNRWAEE